MFVEDECTWHHHIYGVGGDDLPFLASFMSAATESVWRLGTMNPCYLYAFASPRLSVYSTNVGFAAHCGELFGQVELSIPNAWSFWKPHWWPKKIHTRKWVPGILRFPLSNSTNALFTMRHFPQEQGSLTDVIYLRDRSRQRSLLFSCNGRWKYFPPGTNVCDMDITCMWLAAISCFRHICCYSFRKRLCTMYP